LRIPPSPYRFGRMPFRQDFAVHELPLITMMIDNELRALSLVLPEERVFLALK
jgi:hypothetical protein